MREAPRKLNITRVSEADYPKVVEESRWGGQGCYEILHCPQCGYEITVEEIYEYTTLERILFRGEEHLYWKTTTTKRRRMDIEDLHLDNGCPQCGHALDKAFEEIIE